MEDQKLEVRIGKLEVGHEHLGKNLDRVDRDLGVVSSKIDTLRDHGDHQNERIMDQMSNNHKEVLIQFSSIEEKQINHERRIASTETTLGKLGTRMAIYTTFGVAIIAGVWTLVQFAMNMWLG